MKLGGLLSIIVMACAAFAITFTIRFSIGAGANIRKGTADGESTTLAAGELAPEVAVTGKAGA